MQRKRREDHLRDHHADFGARHGGRQHRTQADSINYNNEWVELYNNAAKKLMAEENIPVNDLYALCKEDEHYYKCPDMLHLTEEGYRKCAKQAADMILKELGEA